MKFLEIFACGKNKKKIKEHAKSSKYEVNTTISTDPKSYSSNSHQTPTTQVDKSSKGSVVANTNKIFKRQRSGGSFYETGDEDNETKIVGETSNLRLDQVIKAGTKNPQFKQLIQDIKDLNFEDRLRIERYVVEKIINVDTDSKYLLDPIWVHCFANYLTEKVDDPAPDLFQPELSEGFILNSYVYSINSLCWVFLGTLYKGTKQSHYICKETLKNQLLILTEKQPCLDAQLEATPYLCDKIINCKALLERRHLESNYIMKHEEKKTPTSYIINKIWYKSYKKYLDGGPRPENEVDNSTIEACLKAETFSEHYCFVNEFVWLFLAKIYEISIEVPVEFLHLEDLPEHVKSFDELMSEELVHVLDTEIESDKHLMSQLSYTTKKLLELNEVETKEPSLILASVSEIEIINDETNFGDLSSSLYE